MKESNRYVDTDRIESIERNKEAQILTIIIRVRVSSMLDTLKYS